MTTVLQDYIDHQWSLFVPDNQVEELAMFLDLFQALEDWRSAGIREADFALMGAISRFEAAQAQWRAS